MGCVRGGTPKESFFVHSLLVHANMPQSSAAGVPSSSQRSRRLVSLGSESHGDSEFWRWVVEAGMDASEGGLSASMYRLVARPSCRPFFRTRPSPL